MHQHLDTSITNLVRSILNTPKLKDADMHTNILAFAAAFSTLATITCASPSPTPSAFNPPALSKAETSAGWQLLFDGTPASATTNFRAFRQPAFPKTGWVIEDGHLRTVKGAEASDIVTANDYADFELSLEYRCTPGANSGIIYRVTDKHDATWQTGPEFQVIDDAGVDIGNNKKGLKPEDPHSAGSLYDMVSPPATKTTKPAGEWNTARIRLKDGLLQHFLNDVKLLECRVDDQSWSDRIAMSKFKDYPGFGLQPRGRIALQHHGDEVAYRNIRVRDLSSPMPGEIALFNGKSTANWMAFVPDLSNKQADPMSVWTVIDRVLVCAGTPAGYIRTKDDYTNYILKVEWRWSPDTRKAGNSGVLLRVQQPDNVWPTCIEAQLQSGRAGDFWNIGDLKMTSESTRLNGRNTKHTHAAEHAIGEWNDYEIIVDGSNIALFVNGEQLNRAWDVQTIPGKIALQSEGTEIHFRKVALSPIP